MKIVSRLALCWTLSFWGLGVGAPLFGLFLQINQKSEISFFDPVLLSIAKATLIQALLSTAISAVLGLFLGLWVKLTRFIEFLWIFPQSVPAVVAAMVGVLWLGRSGVLAQMGVHLDWIYSIKAVILVHVFYNAPWIALGVAQAKSQISESYIEASRSLGAGWLSRFIWIIWPEIRWTLASYMAQVFSLCVMSFALVLVLGGGPPVETLETAIYTQMRYGISNISGAVVCAFWEILLTLIPWGVVLYLNFKKGKPKTQTISEKKRSEKKSFLNQIVLYGVCVFWVTPYFVLFSHSAQWEKIFSIQAEVLTPLKLSLELALCTSILATITAAAAVVTVFSVRSLKTRFLLNWILSLPSGLSVLVLGLGVWILFGAPLEGSFLAMVLLQATLFFPIAFRTFWPLALDTRKRLIEAAVSLGASPIKAILMVEGKRWKQVGLRVIALIAGGSIGEVAAVSLFYSEKLVPLPLLMTRWMSQYRFEEAQSVAAVLLLISASTVFFVTYRGGVSWKKDFA